MDWQKVLAVATNYVLTFAAGWGTGVLAGLTGRQSVAFGFVTLGSNALGLHQAKPEIVPPKIELPK